MIHVTLFHVFAVVAAGILLMAWLAGSRAALRGMRAGMALVLASATMALAYWAGAELLGRPKPVRLAFLERGAEEAALVGAHYVEGEAIWLWLVLPGETVPRAYALPWSTKVAEELRKAQAEAEQNGTSVEVRGPFRRGQSDGEIVFYPPPPPPMPDKGNG